jgi:hypothetical protein
MAEELSQHEGAGARPACFHAAHGLAPEVFVDKEVFCLARRQLSPGHLDREWKNASVAGDLAFVRPQESMQGRPGRAVFTPTVHEALRDAGLREPSVLGENGSIILIAWQRSANDFEIEHRALGFSSPDGGRLSRPSRSPGLS